MSISKIFLPEFDQEMANTRKILERFPEDRSAWQPHAKSMSLGRLAGHLAELPGWVAVPLEQDALDFAPPGGAPFQPFVATSRQELLERFDRGVAAGRAALEAASDETFRAPWSLLRGGQTIFTLPRTAVMRGVVFNHIIHHRGQLTVYLRLNDVPLPAIYGPSADEGAF